MSHMGLVRPLLCIQGMKTLAFALLFAAPTFTACAINDEGQLVPASQVPEPCTSNCPSAPPLLLHRMESGAMTYVDSATLLAAAHGSYVVEVTGAMAMP